MIRSSPRSAVIVSSCNATSSSNPSGAWNFIGVMTLAVPPWVGERTSERRESWTESLEQVKPAVHSLRKPRSESRKMLGCSIMGMWAAPGTMAIRGVGYLVFEDLRGLDRE
jgi:hypothetical protein